MVSNLNAKAVKGERCAVFALMALKRSETLLYLYLLSLNVPVDLNNATYDGRAMVTPRLPESPVVRLHI